MTDAGMTGDYDSIIGMQKDEPIRRFTSGIPAARFERRWDRRRCPASPSRPMMRQGSR
jgi:calcineurin-like phosphoesterase